jgi:hypothetical protein
MAHTIAMKLLLIKDMCRHSIHYELNIHAFLS